MYVHMYVCVLYRIKEILSLYLLYSMAIMALLHSWCNRVNDPLYIDIAIVIPNTRLCVHVFLSNINK